MQSRHTTQLALDFEADGSTQPEPPAKPNLPSLPEHARQHERAASSLRARDDTEAIEAWIAATCDDSGRDETGRPAHTARAYAREARRFLLWLQRDRGTSLAAATLEDCTEYKRFIGDPQPRERWCGPRGARIGSPEWRPFSGPLCARSCRQTMTILGGLYRFLQDQKYLLGNPWRGVRMPRDSEPKLDTSRSLSRTQWIALERELREGPRDRRAQQLGWAVRFLYMTGLRLSEVSSARCEDLHWIDLDEFDDDWPQEGATPVRGSWVVRVCGKGMKIRDVPLSSQIVDELGEMLAAEGLSNDPRACRGRPLLVAMKADGTGAAGEGRTKLPAQGLYRQLRRLFRRAAMRMSREGRSADADVFLRMSTHWLRHTHCSHSIAQGTPLDVVRLNAGHSSLQTTSVYVSASISRRVRESRRLSVHRAP